MRENRENMVSFTEPSFKDLNPYAIQADSELSLGAGMVANPFAIQQSHDPNSVVSLNIAASLQSEINRATSPVAQVAL